MSRLILAGLLLLLGLAGPAAAQRPDFTGRWVLKTDAPESPEAGDTAAAPLPGDSAGAADSARAGPASDLRPVLRRRGRPAESAQLTRLVGMAQPVPAFRVSQSDTAITFVNQDGFTYVVRPGGERDSLALGDEWIEVRARWRGRVLEVEFRPPGGGRFVESYHLADSGTYLRLEVVIEHDLLAQRLWRPRMYRLDDSES